MSQPKETTRFCRLMPFLNPNTPSSPPSTCCPSKEFEAQSHSIVNSNENWDAFRQEAREKKITTAAGLKELLKERYARKFSLDNSEKGIGLDEEGEDIRPSIAPSKESYRTLIRGNADHIMGLHLEPTKRKGHSKVKLSRMASKLSFSMPDYYLLDEQQEGEKKDGQCRRNSLANGLSKSWIGESGNLQTLLMEDECLSLDSKWRTTSADVPKNKGTNDIDGSSDSSDDDRSNNGDFEYYPKLNPTRGEALERRRSHRTKDGDVRQSLPPNCERFIGIVEAVGDNSIKKGQRILNDAKSCVSRSLPPTKLNEKWAKRDVDDDERSRFAFIDLLISNKVHEKNEDSKVLPTATPCNFELNNRLLEELEQEIYNTTLRNQDSETKVSNVNSSGSLDLQGLSFRNSMPPNAESYLDTVDDQESSSARNLRQSSGISKSLPPKTPHELSIQAPSAAKNFNASFSSAKKTASTGDISQITDGSELLVGWGECYDSDSNEDA
ncbi:hypothetical protein ACHAWO_009784 [Cyclotella atomus]|uniref:Uncharacterized protein n=1 Tax=Cyclotella atomus TaxID=382360 RepID=A0ABD3N6D1_9STRA